MCGEVVEAYSDSGDECLSAPSSRELELAGRLLGHIIDNVHRIVHLVRNDAVSCSRVSNGLRIELAEGCDFPDRPLEIALAEEIARAGEYLTADDLLVGEVIAVDDDVVQCSLLALDDAHLDIHRVTSHIHLDRLHIEEEISVVPVELGYIHLTLLSASGEPFLHGDDVIHVTLADLENGIEGF